MVRIEKSNRHGRADEKRIRDFESEFGIRLPEAFRNHLLMHNGGEPEPSYFDTKGNTSRIHGSFYGIHPGPEYSRLDSNYTVFSERVPPSMLPIACDPLGNQICIGISEAIQGKIFFWDHELTGEESTEEIAGSFGEFLSGLYEWIDPTLSDIDLAIKQGRLEKVIELIEAGLPIELKDQYGRTAIERAAIHGKNEIIRYLWGKGGKLGNALALAQKNAEFFPGHIKTVALIVGLTGRTPEDGAE